MQRLNINKATYLLLNKNFKSLKFLSESIAIRALDMIAITEFMKENKQHLIVATAMDQPYKYNRFFLHYIFSDYINKQKVYIHTNTDRIVPSLTNIYSSLIWVEREIYDMFGIYFKATLNGINDLRRILTDYNFKGHPLRKDFTLIGYNEKLYSLASKTIQDNWRLIF